MAHKVIILYRLYMPYYFLGTFTEYPYFSTDSSFLGVFLRINRHIQALFIVLF